VQRPGGLMIPCWCCKPTIRFSDTVA